jgi:CheY-like chemotaxis protein
MTLTATATRHALVVDDMILNRQLAVAFLNRLGWHTAEADGGAAAQSDIDRFLANGFDAVLTKPISMQRMNDVINALCPG